MANGKQREFDWTFLTDAPVSDGTMPMLIASDMRCGKPGCGMVRIDKQMALLLLESSTFNRDESRQRLDGYMRSMLDGQWVDGVAVVSFDREGRLLNGHHTLKAISATDTTQLCIVAVGLPPEAKLYYDQKIASRSTKDTLQFIAEMTKLPEKWYICSKVVHKILQIESGVAKHDDNELARAVLDMGPRLRDVTHRAGIYNSLGMASLNDFYAAGWYICEANGVEAWKEFVDTMFDMKVAGSGAPTNRLAKYLRDTPRRKCLRMDVIRAVWYCWNKYCLGEQVNRMQVPEDLGVKDIAVKGVNEP